MREITLLLTAVSAIGALGCVGSPIDVEPPDEDLPQVVVAIDPVARAELRPMWAERCEPRQTEPFGSPETEAERVFDAVLDRHLDELDEQVLRFARGDVSVYRGSARAQDDGGALPFWGRDGELPAGDVMAVAFPMRLLSFEDEPFRWTSGPGHLLRIVRDDPARLVDVYQLDDDLSATWVSPVLHHGGAYESAPTPPAKCLSCAPRLVDMPDRFSVDPLVATRSYHVHPDGTLRHEDLNVHEYVDFTIELTAQLERVPPPALTFDDLVRAHPTWNNTNTTGDALREFLPRGDEMVRVSISWLVEDVAIPDEAPIAEEDREIYRCSRSTEYEIETFVAPQCLLDAGVRDLQILEQRTCCGPLCTACELPEWCDG